MLSFCQNEQMYQACTFMCSVFENDVQVIL